MRGFLSKTELRALSLILALSVLTGSIPLTASVIVVPGPTHPTFTINLCQPFQTACGVSGNPIARPAAGSPQLFLHGDGRVSIQAIKFSPDLVIAPASPPPKL